MTSVARVPEFPINAHVPNAGWAILATLKNYGVDAIFGIPGTHNLEFYRHLPRLGIRAITSRHEQGAGYAADAYSVVTGEPGVVITTSGPGVLNALSSMGNAYCESRPMIVLSPGAPRGLEGSDRGLLHETKDVIGAVSSVALWSRRVESAQEAIAHIHEAFDMFRSGRPRPVHIEVPLDVLEAEVELTEADLTARERPPLAQAQAHEIEAASNALQGARRPVILAGGGAHAAGASLTALAQTLQAPVVTTINGKGAVPETNPLSLGAEIRMPGALEVVNQADVLLMIGTKIGEAELWGGDFSPTGTVIRIDRVASRLNVNWDPDITLLGDSATVVPALVKALGAPSQKAADFSTLKEAIRKAVREGAPETVALCEELVKAIPPGAIVTGDSSQVTYFGMASVFLASGSGRFLYTPTFATLGYGLPAAIGAQVAEPDTPVVAVVGDGALMFSLQEIATALEQRMSMVIVCVDNGGYGEIKANEAAVGISPIGVDLHQPDWAMIADAFGATGHRVDQPDQLATAMDVSLKSTGVHLIHVPLSTFSSPQNTAEKGQDK